MENKIKKTQYGDTRFSPDRDDMHFSIVNSMTGIQEQATGFNLIVLSE